MYLWVLVKFEKSIVHVVRHARRYALCNSLRKQPPNKTISQQTCIINVKWSHIYKTTSELRRLPLYNSDVHKCTVQFSFHIHQ